MFHGGGVKGRKSEQNVGFKSLWEKPVKRPNVEEVVVWSAMIEYDFGR